MMMIRDGKTSREDRSQAVVPPLPLLLQLLYRLLREPPARKGSRS